MRLHDNPFYILKVCGADDRKTVFAQAESLAFSGDASRIEAALTELTTPRRRLLAELAWLPGKSVAAAEELVALAENDPNAIRDMAGLAPIARCNLLSEAIVRVKDATPAEMAAWTLTLAQSVDKIDVSSAMVRINRDRKSSGFPEITDEKALAELMMQQRAAYSEAARQALSSMPPRLGILSLTLAVEEATAMGEAAAPLMLDDLVDLYERDMQGELEAGRDAIVALGEKIRADIKAKAGDDQVEQEVQKLCTAIREWDAKAQPIQVSAKSRGQRHELSLKLVLCLRKLAVELFNEYDKLKFAQQMIAVMRKAFAELDAAREFLERDQEGLDAVIASRTTRVAAVPETARATITKMTSRRTPIPVVAADDDFISQLKEKKRYMRILGGVAVFFVLFVAVKACMLESRATINSQKGVVATPMQQQMTLEHAPVVDPEDEKLPGRMEKPAPGGAERMLAIPEIRYCLSEKANMKKYRYRYRGSSGIQAYNMRVDDYNSRCAQFSYRAGDLEQAERDTGETRY